MKQLYFVGTYTEPILFGTGEVFHGRGEGICLCEFDGTQLNQLAVIPAVNPSFVCADWERRKLYAVGEAKTWNGCFGGSVSQWSWDEANRFTLEATYPTGGMDPCHLSLSPDRRWVTIANFASGSLTAFPLDEQGHMLPERRICQHTGHGVHPVRQKGPHAHSALYGPDGCLYVPDLGLDEVVCYRMGTAGPVYERSIRTAPGSGPRAGVFSRDGRHFYLINELGASVTHFADGEARETVSTLPAGYTGESICADVHLTPDGRELYASNRGHDSLAHFHVAEDGSLQFAEHCACGGRTPRNFAVDPSGRYVLVANQDTNNVVTFAIGPGGTLQPVGETEIGSPVCLIAKE